MNRNCNKLVRFRAEHRSCRFAARAVQMLMSLVSGGFVAWLYREGIVIRRGCLADCSRVALAIGLLLATAVACSAQITFTEYTVPTSGSQPYGITVGPDGNLWFTEESGNKIGRITPSGAITEFDLPTSGSNPVDITTGADGNLWFTEYRGNAIGTITTSGVVTEISIPSSNPYPYGITVGLDGNVWFTETGVADGNVGPIGGNNICSITTSGVITEFPIPTSKSVPEQIIQGPDGNLWFADLHGNNIGRITTSGVITEFPIPTAGGGAIAITMGSDGNLWFGEYLANKIGRITTSGVITEFPIPSANAGLNGITVGPDGNLWFTELGNYTNGKIGRITTTGVITEFQIPSVDGGPIEITTGPDGNLWFTEQSGKIVKATVTAPLVITITSPTQMTYLLNQAVAASYSCSGGSGNVTCTGSVPNGSNIDTSSVGTKIFTVSATDKGGNTTNQSITYSVGYKINPLYDQTKAVKSGACYPIKLQITDVNGANYSSSSIMVHAVSVTMASTNAPGALESVGNANPDNDFRYDTTLGGYIFNLSTNGIGMGTWNLNFTAGADPTIYTAQFQVK